MKRVAVFIVFALPLFSTVEEAVYPLMDQFEKVESHKPSRYSQGQWREMEQAFSRSEEKLRVMSYNMLFDIYDERHLPENKWVARKDRVAELILAIQPDLLGSQELMAHQVEELLEQLGDAYGFYGIANFNKFSGREGEVNGFFYRKERLEVIEKLGVRIPAIRAMNRAVTICRLFDKRVSKEFVALNSHLSFFSAEERDHEVRHLLKLASLYSDLPTFIMGDFNTFPQRLDMKRLPFYDGDYMHRLFKKKGWKNASEIALLGCLGPLSTYTNASQEDVTPFKGTGTPGIILDHIYVNDPVTVLIHAVEKARVNGHYPSDHMPVIVDVLIH